MPRLIDAEPLVEYFEGLARSLANARCFGAADAIQGAAEKLRNAPTIDAEPVVRCKDCKHFDMRSMECQNDRVSTDHEGGASYSLNFYLEDYCSFGERKMDEEVQE